MKRLLLILIAPVLSTGLLAQNAQWGAKAGLNLAKETVDNGSTKVRPGIYLGLFAEFPIAPKADFQPELLYSMQGAKYYGQTDRFDYLTLPAIFKIYLYERALSMDVGLQFGYLVNAKYDNGSTIVNVYDNVDNKFDLSFCFGLSYKIDQKLDASLRFASGLTKISDRTGHKNSLFQLGLGHKF